MTRDSEKYLLSRFMLCAIWATGAGVNCSPACSFVRGLGMGAIRSCVHVLALGHHYSVPRSGNWKELWETDSLPMHTICPCLLKVVRSVVSILCICLLPFFFCS